MARTVYPVTTVNDLGMVELQERKIFMPVQIPTEVAKPQTELLHGVKIEADPQLQKLSQSSKIEHKSHMLHKIDALQNTCITKNISGKIHALPHPPLTTASTHSNTCITPPSPDSCIYTLNTEAKYMHNKIDV